CPSTRPATRSSPPAIRMRATIPSCPGCWSGPGGALYRLQAPLDCKKRAICLSWRSHHLRQRTRMSIERINPPALYGGAPHGLSHATIDHASGLVFVSGQVDWGREYKVRHTTLAE